MSTRARVAVLIAIGVVLCGGSFLALTIVLRPSRPAPIAAASAAPRSPQQPPGRTLGEPASREPESVDRATLLPKTANVPGAEDGLVSTVVVTTPPFVIDRRYRSMEGPYAEYQVAIKPGTRELWWWKGAKIELLDESGKVLGSEFMCHLNVDVGAEERQRNLGTTATSKRLLTLTQGEMESALPRGAAVPVASDETWSLMFQVLNHNRDGVFRVKQRLTLYFVRDADLFAPVDPLDWYAGSVWVSLDKNSREALAFDKSTCHCCAPLERALEATNNLAAARLVDDSGRTLVGHWVVPPGKSTWQSPLKRYIPPSDMPRKLVATWTHVHPFATEVRLVAHKPGCAPEVVTKSTVESLRDGRVGLVNVRSFASAEGVTLEGGAAFELAVDYDNTSGRPQDSMTSLGMFVVSTWTRPEWATRAQNTTGMDASCGLPR